MSNYFNKIKESIEDSISTKEKLFKESASKIEELAKKLALVIKNGGKILVCGNGGSAADSQHFAAELVIRYRSSFPRPAIPAIALTVDSSILSAGGNDIGFENVFARQVEALGQKGDALLGISTSGNSENVLRAIEQANKIGLLSFGLLGAGGARIAPICNHYINVPSNVTARIQESHILILHLFCEIIEEDLFQKNNWKN